MVTKRIEPEPVVEDDSEPDQQIGGVTIHYMTKQEAQEFFDEEAMKTLGISGEEFLRRWEAGDWQPVPDDTEGRKIARLSMKIPVARYAKS